MTTMTTDSIDEIDGAHAHPLISLIRSMNATHSEELGDFLCLHEPSGILDIMNNDLLRGVLESIITICNCNSEEVSPLLIDISHSKLYLPNTDIAVKGFLREKVMCGAGSSSLYETRFFSALQGSLLAIGSIVHSLPEKVKMVSINLSRCRVEDSLATVASEALKGLPSLIELDMSYNRIGRRGFDVIFSTLLSHPLCRIQNLNLEWNWDITASSALTLIHTLQHQNRSLTTLNLAGTGIAPSAGMMRVFYDFSCNDEGNLFDIPERYNNHLRLLKLGSSGSAQTEKLFAEALKMNEVGPEEAVARKVDHYLEKNRNSIYEAINEDPNLVYQTLEFIGKYGTLQSLLKLVKDFSVNGSISMHSNRVMD